MPRGLTQAEENLRSALQRSGATGSNNEVLDILNKKLSSTMTRGELKTAAEKWGPGSQAAKEMDRRDALED